MSARTIYDRANQAIDELATDHTAPYEDRLSYLWMLRDQIQQFTSAIERQIVQDAQAQLRKEDQKREQEDNPHGLYLNEM